MAKIGKLERRDLGRIEISSDVDNYLLTACCKVRHGTVDVKIWVFKRDGRWSVVAREGHLTSGETHGLESAASAEQFGIDAINKYAQANDLHA